MLSLQPDLMPPSELLADLPDHPDADAGLLGHVEVGAEEGLDLNVLQQALRDAVVSGGHKADRLRDGVAAGLTLPSKPLELDAEGLPPVGEVEDVLLERGVGGRPRPDRRTRGRSGH